MARKRGRDIVHRWGGNPSISIEHLPFGVNDICNAGAVKIDGTYLLLVSIQNLKGDYSVWKAESKDGYHFTVSDKPVIAPSEESPNAPYDEQGILDPRITALDGMYYITYDVVSGRGYRLGLARTKDFETIERLPLMSEPDTKAGVLFPRKIKGKYARLERPWEGGSIWLSYSDDLEYWGWSEVVMTPRGGFWDFHRIGAATPPIEISLGWLFIYYGVKETSAGPLFRLGAAILDAGDPAQVVGRTNVPILSPREEYERLGDRPNLVFSCGAILESNEEVRLYYGASNSCICVGTTTLTDIVDACLESAREF